MSHADKVGRAAIFLFLLLVGAGLAHAQSLPDLKGPVSDLANVIDDGTEAELDKRIRALQTATGDAVVVVTVPTFAPFASIEEYAARLFEKAGIGERNKDNGVLLVLAVSDRRVKIEVGYGLEEFVPDGYAGDVLRRVMLPPFREGDYGGGMLAGATTLIQRIADRRGVTLQDIPRPARERRSERGTPSGFGAIVFAIFVFIMIMGRLQRKLGGGRRFRGGGPMWPGSTWSGWSGGGGGFGGGFGGGGGGGFGGFGGGRSGGGGASGGF
jgi:uncharacterized protein